MGYLGATPIPTRFGARRQRVPAGFARQASRAVAPRRELRGSWRRVPGGYVWNAHQAAATEEQLGFSLKPPSWLRKAQPGKILAKAAVPLAVGASLFIPGVAPAALAVVKTVGAGALSAGKLLGKGAIGTTRLLGKGVGKSTGFLAKKVVSVVAPPKVTPPITDAEQSGALTSAGVQAAQAAAASGKSSPILDALQQKAVDVITGQGAGTTSGPAVSTSSTTAAPAPSPDYTPAPVASSGGGGGGGYAPSSDTPGSSSTAPTPPTAGNMALPIAVAAGVVLLLATAHRKKARA